MAGETGDIKRINWADYCSCVHLFRAFQMAISPHRLGIAFCGLLAIVLVGLLLDWSQTFVGKASRPVAVVAGGMSTTELQQFVMNNGDKALTLKWAEDARKAGLSIQTTGTFTLLLHQARTITNQLTDSVISLRPSGVVASLISIGYTKLWLLRMHTGFAILFIAASLAVWAMVGGAICRLTALEVARDERIGPMEAIRFTREKLLSFVLAPVVPAAAMFIGLVALAIPGAFGLIPWLGEIGMSLFFGLWMLVGFLMALLIVGSVGGGWLMYPTIAVEGSDAFDAISRSFGYLMARPWRTVFYLFVSMVYGALCLTFVKIVARLTLACVHAGLGLSMNIDHVKVTGSTTEVGKLDAIWQAPTIDFVSNPYMGTFITKPESWGQTIAQWLVQGWVYGLAILIGAFVVSFAYSSFTIIYFLLRREVDATGFDDVYLDDLGPPPSPAAPAAQPAKSGTSLPIIGQP